MAPTPQDLRFLADQHDPRLRTALRYGLQAVEQLANDVRVANFFQFGSVDSLLAKVNSIDLTRQGGAADRYGVSFNLSEVLVRSLDSAYSEAKARAGDEFTDRLGGLVVQADLLEYALRDSRSFAGPADAATARSIVGSLASQLDEVAGTSDDGSRLGVSLAFESWAASIIFVLLNSPYEFGGEPIGELSYVRSLGASFENADQMRGEIENLIGRLHQAAQDEATSDELSTILTQHARDGHRLFFGSDGEDREVPPLPALVQGWVTGTLDLLSRITGLTSEAEAFANDLAADPSPSGFRDALNKQLGDADIPEVAAYRGEKSEDFVGNEFVRLAAERLGDALNELLTPDKVGVATGIGWWLAETFHLGPGSYLLSTIIVLALLMRRQEPEIGTSDVEEHVIDIDDESE